MSYSKFRYYFVMVFQSRTNFWSVVVLTLLVVNYGESSSLVSEENLAKYASFSKKYARAWLDGVIPTAVANVSEKCRTDSITYRDNLAAMEDWALRMFDATGKMPDGFYNGNWHALGDYEECLRIDPPSLDFRGKYCQVFLWFAEPKPQAKLFPMWFFQQILGSPGIAIDPAETYVFSTQQPSFGICIPSSCSAADVTEAVTAMTTGNESIFGIGLGLTGTTSEGFCAVGDTSIELDAESVAMISVLSALGIQILIGTLVDLSVRLKIFKKGSNIGFRYFDCFSVIANGERLLSVKPSSENLSCIHGLRFISFTWVLLGHAFAWVYTFPTSNLALVLDQALTSVAFQAITNSFLSVDSFFFISGLLLAYLYLKAMKKTGKKSGITCQVNPGMLLLHRFLRLTPAYALILGFFATLWPKLNHGPAWDIVNFTTSICKEQWWSNLLYVNNLIEGHGGCLGVTWYLGVEFQIFVVAVFFVWLMYINELIGVAATAVATLAGCIAGAVAMVEWDMPPENIFGLEQFEGNERYNLEYYIKPWFRFPPFFVGMLTGWILYKIRQPTYKKPKWLTPTVTCVLAVVGWIVAAVTASAILYGLSDYYDGDPLVPPEVQAMYGGFHRAVWAVCLGWVVIACVTGYGGPINSFLSWSPFVVLGRLTFCAYLIHIDWMMFYNAHLRTPFYYTNMTMVYNLLGHLAGTLVLSTIAVLAFEAPFLGLEKLIFGASERKEIRKPENENSGKHAESTSNDSDSNEGAGELEPDLKDGIVNPDAESHKEI